MAKSSISEVRRIVSSVFGGDYDITAKSHRIIATNRKRRGRRARFDRLGIVSFCVAFECPGDFKECGEMVRKARLADERIKKLTHEFDLQPDSDGQWLYREDDEFLWRLLHVNGNVASGLSVRKPTHIQKLAGDWRRPTELESRRSRRGVMGCLVNP